MLLHWLAEKVVYTMFIRYQVQKIVARFQSMLEISKIDASLKLVVM